MAIDAVCWLILGTAIAFIACGCHFTHPKRQLASEAMEQEAFDRAA